MTGNDENILCSVCGEKVEKNTEYCDSCGAMLSVKQGGDDYGRVKSNEEISENSITDILDVSGESGFKEYLISSSEEWMESYISFKEALKNSQTAKDIYNVFKNEIVDSKNFDVAMAGINEELFSTIFKNRKIFLNVGEQAIIFVSNVFSKKKAGLLITNDRVIEIRRLGIKSVSFNEINEIVFNYSYSSGVYGVAWQINSQVSIDAISIDRRLRGILAAYIALFSYEKCGHKIVFSASKTSD